MENLDHISQQMLANNIELWNHGFRVSTYTEMLGIQFKLSQEQITNLQYAAILHDIGKILIPNPILQKTTKLSKEEYEAIKGHSEIGEKLLASAKKEIRQAVRSHHERCDGKGYPDGLQREEISLIARIISIADSYDAMTSQRPYNVPKSTEEAIEELEQNAGTQFDPEITACFVKRLKRRSN